MNIDRKTFIGGLIAGIVTPLFGKNPKFEDITIDNYYVLTSEDSISYGSPGADAGELLIKTLKYEANFRDINDVIDELASRKFRYEVTSYIFDENYTRYNDIYLTKEWLTEFYLRHKDEDEGVWREAYTAKVKEFKGIKA